MENPLPESCVGLFTTLCTGWILKKRTKKIAFAQHYQKSKNCKRNDQSPFKGPYLPLRRALFAPWSPGGPRALRPCTQAWHFG